MTIGFKNGCIKLDSFSKTYYSGQVMLGSVVFELNGPLSFSVLNIEYLGEARFLLPKKVPEEHDDDSQSLVNYEGREEYFRVTQCLAGGTGVSTLPAGRLEYRFSFQIPHTAPSSFGDDITYRINAHLYYSDPYRPRDEITETFEVVAPFDLNLGGPAIKQPLELVFEEVYGCDCICGVSPVTISVRLPASGFCPGQVIPILIDVQNDSTVEITKMIFQLTTKECYRTNEPVAEFMPPEKVLMTVKKGPVMGKSKCNFTCALTVPDMIVPNLSNCRLIDKSYFFKTTIKLSGCNSDLQDESEIYLGLVPLKELVQGEYVHPMAHKLPTGPIPNPNAGFSGPGLMDPSNTPYSIKTQFDPFPATNRPPSYTENTEQIPLTNRTSLNDIGFKIPDGVQQPPYPVTNPMGNTAAYPTNKWGTGSGYPYPGSTGIPAPGNPGAIPSAPPADS